MNFDTKHLVRWGIPGWLMIIAIGPYLFFVFKEVKNLTASVNLVALGAFLTVMGVPLGYLLNQIHHSVTWVIPKSFKNGWDEYFEQELKLDDKFLLVNGEKIQERYRYLLSRKHELGGITVSLFVSGMVILLVKIYNQVYQTWSWIYLITILILLIIIMFSRNYSSKNIDRYFNHYLNN